MIAPKGRVRPVLSRPVLVASVVAFVLGWAAATGWTAHTGSERISLRGDDEGVVTFVNVDGSKFCIMSDRDDREHCGAAYTAPAVSIGQRVEISAVRVPLRHDVADVTWIVTMPPSQ
jgi:hypothetical protein